MAFVRVWLGMPEHDCLLVAVSAAEFLTHGGGERPAAAAARAADTLRHAGLFEAVSRDRRLLHGHEAAREAVSGAVHDPAFVFLDDHGRPRPGRLRRDAGAHSEAHRVRHQRVVLVAPWPMSNVRATDHRAPGRQAGALGRGAQFTKDTEVVFIEVDTIAKGLSHWSVAESW